MKLLYCKSCQDIVRPLIGKERKCDCGKSSIVAHHDNLTVSYSGEQCILIGIKNSSFIQAIHNQPNEGMGKDFTAFVLPKNCQSVKKL